MTGLFSGVRRTEILGSLMKQPVDILIIGGGITGAGIALDAVSRGLSVGLVDMQDFAAGTSSRSTKLVHGGLRYLQQYELALVKEIGRERNIVYELGPHVTHPEKMLLPIYQDGLLGLHTVSLGLKLYDYLAGVKRVEHHQMLSVAETLALVPGLRQEKLLGAGYYVEYRTDDARLTIEVIKEAVARGVKAINYVKATSFGYENNQLQTVTVEDLMTQQSYLLTAKTVINATGPWVDTIRTLDEQVLGKKLQLSKGIHIVVDQSVLPLHQAIYFDAPDKRMIFAIPRVGKVYLGTTDIAVTTVESNPRVTEAEQIYLCDCVKAMFPEVRLSTSDIESCFAGFRPLISIAGKEVVHLSRHDEIWNGPSGLISIAGGKLTGYRKMAEKVVDQLIRPYKGKGLRYLKCQTRQIPISGGAVGGAHQFENYIRKQVALGMTLGMPTVEAEMLARLFGSNVEKVFGYHGAAKQLEQVHLSVAERMMLLYCLAEEMVMTPVDFFRRRTGRLLFDLSWVYRVKEDVLQIMSAYFNWRTDEMTKFQTQLEVEIEISTTAIIPS